MAFQSLVQGFFLCCTRGGAELRHTNTHWDQQLPWGPWLTHICAVLNPSLEVFFPLFFPSPQHEELVFFFPDLYLLLARSHQDALMIYKEIILK